MTFLCLEVDLPVTPDTLAQCMSFAAASLKDGCGICGQPAGKVGLYIPKRYHNAILPNGRVMVPCYVLCPTCKDDPAITTTIVEEGDAVLASYQPNRSYQWN